VIGQWQCQGCRCWFLKSVVPCHLALGAERVVSCLMQALCWPGLCRHLCWGHAQQEVCSWQATWPAAWPARYSILQVHASPHGKRKYAAVLEAGRFWAVTAVSAAAGQGEPLHKWSCRQATHPKSVPAHNVRSASSHSNNVLCVLSSGL
jgi:hypothetical protein